MQEVIVYRNPMEAAIWNGIMNSDFPIILFCVLMLVISVGLFALQNKFIINKWWYNKYNEWVLAGTLLVSGVASYFILV